MALFLAAAEQGWDLLTFFARSWTPSVGAGGTSLLQTSGSNFSSSANRFEATYAGSGFALEGTGTPTGGLVTRITLSDYYVSGATFAYQPPFQVSYFYSKHDSVLSGFSTDYDTLLPSPASNPDPLPVLLAGNDEINGANKDDRLPGYAGNDLIDGAAGDDTLAPGTGTDTVVGGSGTDWVDYSVGIPANVAANAVEVDLESATATDPAAATDTLDGIENIRGTNALGAAGSVDDRLSGNAGDNAIAGLRGIDLIDGRDGVDTADYSSDEAAGGTTGVFAWLEAGFARDGFGTADILVSVENLTGSDLANPEWGIGDLLVGSDGVNRLSGLGGNDTLMGLGGDDVLVGGPGLDIMLGGEGRDLFVIDNESLVGGEYDLILDFVPGMDVLEFGNLASDASKLQILTASGGVLVAFQTSYDGPYFLNIQSDVTAQQVAAALFV